MAFPHHPDVLARYHVHVLSDIFAPRNAVVVVAFFVSALSVASSIFIILEMDQPFGGLIHLSNEPILQVLEQLGQP